MSFKTTARRLTKGLGLGSVCAAVLIFASAAMGDDSTPNPFTNAIPFAFSFESYTNNQPLVGLGGWYSDDAEALIVQTNNYTDGYLGELPLGDDVGHTKVLQISAPASNSVVPDLSGTHTNWVDMMILPRFWQEDEAPQVPEDVQLAVYFNSNGYINTYAQYVDGGLTNGWLQLGESVASNQWLRLTIAISYGVDSQYNFYQLQLNNSTYLTHPKAWSAPSTAAEPGGTWFLCGDHNNFFMSSCGFSGTAYIDDFVTTNGQPKITPVYTITPTVDAGGEITRNGEPVEGVVTIVSGRDVLFDIAAKEGYSLTDVLADGSSQGATNQFGWTNVQTNHTLSVITEAQPRTLVVSSPYGTPTPDGTNAYTYGAVINASVAGSPIVLGSGNRRVCTGWTRTTSDPASGSGTNVSFTLRGATTLDETTLTWVWQDQYLLDTATKGYGTVNLPDTWYPTGTLPVDLVASPSGGSAFTGWSGDTNGCTVNGATITVPVDQGRAIVANFTGGTTTRGTSVEWLESYGVSNNYDQADLADDDKDGKFMWEEFQTGTEPDNSNSVFQVLWEISYGASNVVAFYGTTNTGVTTPFGMYSTDSLSANTAWSLVDGNIPRSPDGTNVWWDLAPTAPAFYMPVATNGL